MLLPSSLPKKTEWERHVEHKEAADELDQRSGIFFGLDMLSGARICVPRSSFQRGHCHIQGKTGSGKTASSLLSIALQSLRGYREANGAWAKKSPLIIFDLKGDESFFHAVRAAAEREGRQFRFFSTLHHHGYHFFDPFQVQRLRRLEPSQLASTIIRALSLDYGLDYGRQYFSAQNVDIMEQAITDVQRAGGELTVGRIAESLDRLSTAKKYRDASHVVSCFKQLSGYPQVNLSRHGHMPAARIDMYKALESAEVVYIFMDMTNEAPVLRQIAGLQLNALIHAAQCLRTTGCHVPFTFTIIDEFHHIAGSTFGDVLATSRQWGLHFFLANQASSQLEAHMKGLGDVLRTNTSVTQQYNLADAEFREELMRDSGEFADISLSSITNSLGQVSQSLTERRAWYLTNDDINDVNDRHLASFLRYDSGTTFRLGERVKLVLGLHPITKLTYLQYQHTPLPDGPNRVLPTPGSPDRSDGPAAPTAPQQPPTDRRSYRHDSELQQKMTAVWDAIEAETNLN